MSSSAMGPRYPQVTISIRSRNPLALISAVRQGLRRAGVPKREIQEFSSRAFETADRDEVRQLCDEWAEVRGAS